VRAMLSENPFGYLDDTPSRAGRYDVYTVDVYLFTEPLAGLLGDVWERGVRGVLDLVERVGSSNGAAVPWGRSGGILAVCHTLELAALALSRGMTDDVGQWTATAARATATAATWFDRGYVTAHQHRAADSYRGLDRRLQMTLDCLGKLAHAGALLEGLAGDVTGDATSRPVDRDELVPLEHRRPAAAWTYCSSATAFVLPLVGTTTTDYLPAPRNPGLFEPPADSGMVSWTPLVLRGRKRYAGGGVPVEVRHSAGSITATWEGFPEAGMLEPGPEPASLPGRRDLTCSVEGRTLRFEDHLVFDGDVPHAVGIQVTEATGRPLVVHFRCATAHTTTTSAVAGIPEFRSSWGELPRVHQIDVEPAAELTVGWDVTPVLRIVSTAAGHHYDTSLYDPLADRVRIDRLPNAALRDPARLDELLTQTDVFHMHWPEWLVGGGDLAVHRRLIDRLRATGVPIVWTQHNVQPHAQDQAGLDAYPMWAEAASLVVHHSDHGRDVALGRYGYGSHTRHVVMRHGHFGALATSYSRELRADAERELGLRSDESVIRLGIVGAPRADKDVALVMRAMARSHRDDVELLVTSLAPGEKAPVDERIVALPYRYVDRTEYDRALATIDALVMPFAPDGAMITTGTIADAIGLGIPVIATRWGYLVEELGDAALAYFSTEDDLVRAIDALDRSALAAAAEATTALQASHDWSLLAEQLYRELDALDMPHL
jgi:glycosyltransferase involved in cell wall biosynthesis